jgi:zinc protease
VGSKNEEEGKTGFAHLFEHMMFEGSRNVKGSFVSFMERAGANISQGGINGTTNFDRTNYFETVPAGSLPLVLWAESDRMGYLLDAVNQENFDNQREVVKNERRQSMDNVPYGTAVEVIFQNLFPKGHPYSWHIIGSMRDLENASLEDVHQFFRTYYTPNNCVLTIAGEFQQAEAKKLIEEYFGPLPPGPPLKRRRKWEISLPTEPRIAVYDRVPQDRLYLSWPAVAYFEDDDAALDLLTTLLADGKNSRLYRRLVYDDQVASDVNAFNYSLEIAGLVGVVATARPGIELSRIERAIDQEIARIAKDGPTPEELERLLAGQEFDFISGLERIGGFGGKADRLAMYQTFLGSPDRFLQDYERYQRIKAKDLKAVAKKYLLEPRLTISYLPEVSQPVDRREPDRTQSPALMPTPSFEVPVVEARKLTNGLKLLVVQRREVPKVAAALLVKRGASAEPAERTGLSAMTADMLEEGTATRTSLQIEAELDRLGSHLSSGGSREWSAVSLDSLKRHLPESLELLADVALHPSFPDEELERLRKQRLDAILQERVSSSAIAGKALRKALFGPKHPYGWPVGGDEPSIRGIARGDLERFYSSHYSPSSSALIVVGDVSPEEAEKAAEQLLGSWSAAAPSPVTVPPVPAPTRKIHFIDRPGAAQSEIRLAFLAPPRTTEDYHVLEVLNTVLGGGFSGRLNLNLREDKGYTYGAFSSIRYGIVQSLFLSSAPVESTVTRESILEMMKEIEDMHQWRRPVTSQELAHAKENLVRGFAQRFETLSQIAGEIAELEGFGREPSELRDYTAGVESVTENLLEEAARRYLDSSQSILVVVGDRAKIAEDLLRLDLGPVVRLDADGDPM